jgi:hypothetical protein
MNMRFPNVMTRCAVLVALVFALVMAAVNEGAAANNTRVFAKGSQALGTTNFYAIVPAVGDRIAVVKTVEVLTDLGNTRVTFYTNGPTVDIPYAVSSTNIQVASSGTNGFVVGDKIVVQDGNTPNDRYFLLSLHAVGTTNLTFTPAISTTLAAGSRLWRIGTNTFAYGITNGATSPRNSFVGVGEKGQPLVVTVGATSAGSINVAGEYIAE